jgi:hypothetical protein
MIQKYTTPKETKMSLRPTNIGAPYVDRFQKKKSTAYELQTNRTRYDTVFNYEIAQNFQL